MATILIIDDSWVARLALKKKLQALGYTIHEAESVSMGITTVKEIDPDVILLDLLLPEEDGFDFLEQIGEENTIPILVLSADIQKTSKEKALEMGATRFLNKPPDMADLQRIIQEVISP